jgi:uncharacterized protein with PQ loop repeat
MTPAGTVIGLVGQALGIACWIPQVFRTHRTRSAADLSPPMLALAVTAIGTIGVAYALNGAFLFALGQIPSMCLIFALLVMRRRYAVRPNQALPVPEQPDRYDLPGAPR